jgi:Tfp pilus assembly protein PilV
MNNKITNKGFSITEVMIACLALGIMLLPVFMMFSRGTAGTAKNKNDILAQQHAANLLAYAAALSYDDSFLGAGEKKVKEKIVTSSDGTSIDLSMSEDFFDRTMSIKEYKVDEISRAYKLVTVAVEWTQPGEKANAKKEVKLTGLIYK